MSIESDTRDRVIKLEATVEHQSEKIDDLAVKLGSALTKLNEMHDLFQQARGAKWALIAMAGIGGFVSAKIAPLIPWLSFPPR